MKLIWVVLLVLANLALPLTAVCAAKVGEHFKIIPAADGRGEITLVGNGLNYQDAAGNWIESQPVVREYPNGIVCTGATYRVILAANLNSPGSVDLELPADPETGARARMISHPLGLAFYDPETGDSVLLARLQDCGPEVVSNQVVYADAFAGPNGIQGAITYTYGVGRFHQDVILTARPTVTPADFGMGAHARLEILTEFVAAPEPVISEKTLRAATNSVRGALAGPSRPALVDQTLSYGLMRMGMGRAFATPELSQSAATRDALPVVKQLVNIENRTVLTEAVEWNIAAAALEKLPRASGTNPVRQAAATRPGFRREMLAQLNPPSPRPTGERGTHSFAGRLAEIRRAALPQLAALGSQLAVPRVPTGFVIDYELVQTCNSFTFQSGQTYLINSWVQIGYVTIQSGAVIKFATGNLQALWAINTPASGPKAVLTTLDDDSAGAMITNSAHHFTGYQYGALDLSQQEGYPGWVQNLDLRFVYGGIVAPASEGMWCYVYNCWFFKCLVGVDDYLGTSGVAGSDFCQVDYPYSGSGYYDYYSCTTCAVTNRDNDSLPDAWEMQHFGGLSQGVNDDYDGDGTLNGIEYTAGTDPNTIRFTTHFANLYVSNRTVAVTLAVQGGVPYQKTVSINSTNLTTNSWSAYSSNLSFTLPDAEGDHAVIIALRGRVATNPPSTDFTELTLDRIPPVLMITNPILSGAAATVVKPYLQLQGSADEALGSYSYDLTNELGLVTNELVAVVDQYFDAARFDFTTNYFHGFDIALATNVNTITLRVADLAGNVTTTNIAVTLDLTSDNEAPTLTLVWPPNNMHLSGDSFYVRGRIDDETATVVAQQVDANDVTNRVEGIVERNGMFWVEDLPLSTGTNEWVLIATDAAGKVSSINLSVVKSAVAVAITSTPEGEALYEPTGMVSGTVSDPDYTVTVNGRAAEVDEYGNWWAENVPNYGQGTATYDVTASPPSGGSGGGSGGSSGGGSGGGGGGSPTGVSVAKEMGAIVKLTKHLASETVESANYRRGDHYTGTWTKSYDASWVPGTDGQWMPYHQGQAAHFTDNGGFVTLTEYEWSAWDPVGWWRSGADEGPLLYDYEGAKTVPHESLDHEESDILYTWKYWVNHYYAKGVRHKWEYPDGEGGLVGDASVFVSARTRETLYTGGKAKVARKNLFSLTAFATKYGRPQSYPWQNTLADPVASERIEILGEALNSESRLLLVLPENEKINATPTVKGSPHYNAQSSVEKVRLDLNLVSFQEVADYVLRDNDGSTYSPMWATNEASGTEFGNPALYAAGDQVKTFTGFKVTGGGSFPVRVKGIASGGGTSFTLWGTMDSAGGPYAYVDTVADTPLTASKVDFYKPMTIKWQDAHPSRLEFVDAGRSTNQVYVSLKAPITGNLYHTVVHLACSEAGATSEDAAFANTWSHFSGKAVKTWDDQPLYYYQTNTTFAQNNTTVAGLLADTNHFGECGAFQGLLHSAAGVNGVWTTNVEVKSANYGEDSKILVKNWGFSPVFDPVEEIYFSRLVFAATLPDMEVGQTGNSFVDCTNVEGIAGQNSSWPSQKVFSYHLIVRRENSYYDPAYGVSSTSQRQYELQCIAGYGESVVYTGFPNRAAYRVHYVSSVLGLIFNE